MSLKKIRELHTKLNLPLNYQWCYPFDNMGINAVIGHIAFLADMILELAKMIEGKNQDLDNAIEQTNQQVENIKPPEFDEEK